MRQTIGKIGWRLFAVVAAFALWVTFVGSPELTETVTVPLAFENMPQDFALASDIPESIKIEVRGSAPRVRRLDLTDSAAVLDIGDIHDPGERTFTIDRKHIDLPAGIHLVRTIPSQVRLRFERRVIAGVPVNVRFANHPPAGYRVVATEVKPQAVQVAGPATHVRALGAAETDPIDISRVLGTTQFQVPAFIRDPQVHFVSSPIVQVTVQVEKTTEGVSASDGKTVVRH